jgi:hypothetical protein
VKHIHSIAPGVLLVRDEGKNRAYCEKFYADYGAGTGNRGPMFYDLPECATAFDYQKSQRRSSR